ncbi:MAG: ATP-binding protein [Rhodocyclaceae bacterium]|nr:ATP-binding protein [Rhodocyclaceae bacterium]
MRGPNRFSLRRRLLALLLSGTAAFWVLVAGLSYFNAHHEVDELFDVQMAQLGHTLLALALSDADGPEPDMAWPHMGRGHRRHGLSEEPRMMFQLRDGQGRLLLRTPNAPETPLTGREGFSEVRDASGHWRYFLIHDPDNRFQVQIGEDHAVRDELIQKTVAQFMLPILLGLPLLGLWVWHAIGRGLAPLSGIREELDRRGPDHLASLPAEAIPEEIAPLVATLNRLLGEIEQTLESERCFTADAAHELRTPLAALQTQLHVAQRARDEEEREHALNQMREGLKRTSRLVEQMLHLARLDPERSLPQSAPLDLAELARDVCAELGAHALDKGLDLTLEAEESAPMAGAQDWLRVLVRNLVDNAIRYTPTGGQIMLAVSPGSATAGPILHVGDSGPGIPPEMRDAALRRFHRLDGTGQSGHGLGLSIVARIAELHGAVLSLERDPHLHGLGVTLVFPSQA